MSLQRGLAGAFARNAHDVVIVSALRTPITKAKRGGLAKATVADLLGQALKGVLRTSSIDPALIEEVSVGSVLAPGGGANAARMASLWSGIPVATPVHTINRQCASGLAAVNAIAALIQTGQIEIGIGAGVESMSLNGMDQLSSTGYSEEILKEDAAKDCLIPMGITSENVAEKFSISRERQDEFAARSHQRAVKAVSDGHFTREIVPVNTIDDAGNAITVTADDGIRQGVSVASLSKLKPAFKADGSAHAGNSSQVSDGAAAVILARRDVAMAQKLPILGKFVCAAAVGVRPSIMGIGPAIAIPKALERAGLTVNDIDVFEVNEAFASQAVYVADELKIPEEKMNPNGGGISLGHPLGATGARQIATLFNELQRRGGSRIGVTSQCVGSGMGMAAIFVSEGQDRT